MELTAATINARSERQAMDWSLVLASQGIETAIARGPDGTGWVLVVEERDLSRAMESIRQYRLENRRWIWRRDLPGTQLAFHWGALLWALAISLIHSWSLSTGGHAHAAGVMDNSAVATGEWWRLFTAVTLHADPAHLVANATSGFLLLGLAMARYGPGVALLATYLGGVLGNLAGFWIYQEPHRGVGASGMVMAALGMLAVQSIAHWRLGRLAARLVVSGLAGAFLLFVLMGTSPGTDIIAHLGGFVGGALLGSVLAFVPEEPLSNRSLNQAAVLALIALFLTTWSLAFRS
ncbi:MAG TPA: rhomboid family intramembrane serine protease [Methylomirabilota bacterium]|nr:rhomboid family intramembrane serine protease [Methylomirabilota bacterium]